MNLTRNLVFAVTVLAICWFVMMAVHELGHVLGAFATGGTIQRVVLHPLSISQTDVSPNPSPLIVVWLGPIIGCLLPIGIWLAIPGRFAMTKSIVKFLAGFCLIANGCYISIGAFDRVGDCDVMLLHGSPLWTLLAFGMLSVPAGLWIWHQMGSPLDVFRDSKKDSVQVAACCLAILATIVTLEVWLSPL